jgi:hypothetical protein
MKTFKEYLNEVWKQYRAKYAGISRDNSIGTYDTDHHELAHDKLDLDGKAVGWRHVLKDKHPIQHEIPLEKSDDVIHRGMSHAEYHSIMRTGKIQSKGRGNIGKAQEGATYFSDDPKVAAYYSKTWHTSPEKPAYVVSVKRPHPDRIIPKVAGTAEHEIGVRGHIDAKDIVAVHRGTVTSHVAGTVRKVLQRHGGSASHITQHWEKIDHTKDLKEAKMWHGSPNTSLTHLKTDTSEYMTDRAIGAHFAADPDVSRKFSKGLHRGGEGSVEGALYSANRPPRSKFYKVKQKKYKHGAIESDQGAIGSHVAATVFSQPEHKELFKKWAMNARHIDEPTAEKLHAHLSAGRAPSGAEFGLAASKSSQNFKSYMANFDPNLGLQPHEGFKKEVIGHYHNIMAKRGFKGLVYKNTSPMETKGVRSKKSYILFNPQHHKLNKEE